MAEFVQQSLDQIKSELEPVQFLSLEEKRKILKKRERLEYRIRKKTKQEKDFLLYIEYEHDVLRFFKMRKALRGVKSRAEVPVIKRIHHLYQLCETRFPQSTDVWLQHIDFCKEQKDFSRVGRLFTQMLRTHSSEPELWLKAAQWEVDQNNVDGARSLMQHCVTINRTTASVWVEYYKLELEMAKMMRGKGHEINEDDPNVNGARAALVCKHACLQCPDNSEMLVSMIQVADKFGFASSQQSEMLQRLKSHFPHVPHVWDFLAKRLLPSKKKKLLQLGERKEESFFGVYEEAVTEIPSDEMWTLYIQAGLDLLALEAPDQDRFQQRMERVLNSFQRAADCKCLDIDLFPQWMTVLAQGEQAHKVREVSELMVQQYPQSVQAWTQRLRYLFMTLSSTDAVLACLNKAVDTLPDRETWSVWEPALLYLSGTNYKDLESLIEKPCSKLSRQVGMQARLWYLRWTAINKDITATRVMFNKWYTYKPVSVEFYLDYIKQELMQDKIRMKKIRKAFEDAITDYGKTDPELWLEYMRVELKHGDPNLASAVGSRAPLNLPQGPLQDQFFMGHSGFTGAEG